LPVAGLSSAQPWSSFLRIPLPLVLGLDDRDRKTGMVKHRLIFAFQADTVDYGEWRSAVRAEGTRYAVLYPAFGSP
jgi:hypothetical protein